MKHQVIKTIGLGLLLAQLGFLPGWATAASEAGAVAEDADGLHYVERPPEQLMVFQVFSETILLSHGVLGYLDGNRVLLPLGELSMALDFPIAVDTDTGQAQGWFIRENRQFSIDIQQQQVFVEGREAVYDPDRIELQYDDIFVEPELLQTWFPLDLDVQLSKLAVEIQPREPLPVQERKKREARYKRMAGRAGAGGGKYPRVESDYVFADLPFVDVSLQQSFYEGENSNATTAYSASAAGDLFYMNSSMSISGNDDELFGDLRWKLSRVDEKAELLGALKARTVEVGDVFAPSLPLSSDSGGGRGVRVSDQPLGRASSFDATTLRGELPLGWSAELFRNGILVDFRGDEGTGLYEFIDVPLTFGMNVLQVELYGPQGQRRSRVERFNIGSSMVPPGEGYYQVALVENDRDLIPVGSDGDNEGEDTGELRGSFEYEYGLSKAYSLAANVASYSLRGERREYVGFGLRGDLSGAFAQLDFNKDDRGGSAMALRAQSRLGPVSWSWDITALSDYDSESKSSNSSDPIKYDTSLRLDGTIPLGIGNVPAALTYGLRDYESGQKEEVTDLRLSGSFSGVSVSNTLSVVRSHGGAAEDTHSTNGSFLVGGGKGSFSVRGRINYEMDPTDDVTSAAIISGYTLNRKSNLRGNIDREFGDDQKTTVTLGYNRIFDQFSLGVSASGTDTDDYFLGLSMSVGITPPTYENAAWGMRPRNVANGGAAKVRVYLEQTGNNYYDQGDEPLEGVGIGRGASEVFTDAEGRAVVTGLSAGGPTKVMLNSSTLEDPYWLLPDPAWEIVPRAGHAHELEFVVLPSGEIDGTVYLERNGELREVGNVNVQIVNASGDVIDEVMSSFDGFYLFTRVPPGKYIVRIDPNQLERLEVNASAPVSADIGLDSTVVSNVEFTIFKPAEAEAAGLSRSANKSM